MICSRHAIRCDLWEAPFVVCFRADPSLIQSLTTPRCLSWFRRLAFSTLRRFDVPKLCPRHTMAEWVLLGSDGTWSLSAKETSCFFFRRCPPKRRRFAQGSGCWEAVARGRCRSKKCCFALDGRQRERQRETERGRDGGREKRTTARAGPRLHFILFYFYFYLGADLRSIMLEQRRKTEGSRGHDCLD